MHKHFQTFNELHNTHKLTHKILILIIFSITVLLFVLGLSKVNASLVNYVPVPNGATNVCYKIDTDPNNFANHVSCTTREKVCVTNFGVLIGCQSKNPINYRR